MLSSLIRCYQWISNSFMIGSDPGTFWSKLVYSPGDISVVNSFAKASNSKSSSSILSSLSPLMSHFSKQFLIVDLVTSFHASYSHWIATSTSTPLTICIADDSSWILAGTYLTSFGTWTWNFWWCQHPVIVASKLYSLVRKWCWSAKTDQS